MQYTESFREKKNNNTDPKWNFRQVSRTLRTNLYVLGEPLFDQLDGLKYVITRKIRIGAKNVINEQNLKNIINIETVLKNINIMLQ